MRNANKAEIERTWDLQNMHKAIASAIFVFCISNAFANTIECPKGTTPEGETTPEVSEAWCETSANGKTVMHGPYRAWWPNGNLGTEGQYDYGKAVGRWRGWYADGKQQGEEWFKDGRKVKGRYWDKQGKEISKPETLSAPR